jgi:S-adenosylmethionine-dependent methyltransferase
VTAGFTSAVRPWTEGLTSLRNVVRQELVADQLREVLTARPAAGRLRVLDAGCGQGTQALHLARAGHDVTGLDTSAELVDRFAAALSRQPAEVRERIRLVHGAVEAAPDVVGGPFDLVLCHGVLMYVDDPEPMLRALSTVAGKGAMMSLLVRNGLAPAMRDGLRGNWAAALAAFSTRDYVNRLGLRAHAHDPAKIDGALERLGWRRERWFGVRVFSDHREEPAPTGDELERLLAAEREAGRRDPYRGVAALLHLLYGRP